MRPKWRVFVLVLMILPGLILISAIYNRQRQLQYAVDNSPEAFARHAAEVLKQWKTYSYVSLQASNEIKLQISKLIVAQTNHSILSVHQEDLLRDEFVTFFDAYSAGTWDAYKKFRFPAGVAWQWRTKIVYSDWPPYSAEEALDRYFKKGPNFGSETMQTNFFNRYDADYKAHKLRRAPPVGMDARFKEYVYQFSDCSYYSNFLSGVNFDKSRIFIGQGGAQESLQSTPFYPVQQARCQTMARPFPNLGYMDSVRDSIGLLDFTNSIDSVRAEYGNVLTVDAFFFCDASPPENPLPLMVRFYWSPADGQWLPNNLIIGTLDTLIFRYPIF